MSNRAKSLALLRGALNDQAADFHDGQWEAIDALTSQQQRLLVVQRTGWGKSLVYFMATRLNRDNGRGLTLIISPLLALMRNQVDAAKKLGVEAISINSTYDSDERENLEQMVLQGQADAVLISPEQLANDGFMARVIEPISDQIGLMVVDEAHCISDWGHDFRPDYRRLRNILRQMPANTPILCTTATANDRVIADIQQQLGDIAVQRGSLMRESLRLQTLKLPTKASRLAWLADHISTLPGTGIIYTLTIRDAMQVARWLNENDVKACAYYSGSEDREVLETKLLNNKIKVLVATTALGMGYDKPDLGFVVHFQAPGSVIGYYQQVGRAGRAIDDAIGILMSGHEDDDIHKFFRRNAFPNNESIEQILTALDNSDGLSTMEIQKEVNIGYARIMHALKFLSAEQNSPVIKNGTKWQRTAIEYSMDLPMIERLTQQRETEWGEMQSYINEEGCLMKFLAEALNDPNPKECGKCASCLRGDIIESSVQPETTTAAQRFLRQSEFPLKCKIQIPKDALPQYELSGNLPRQYRAKTGMVLSRWKDDGWGHMVAADKENNKPFRDKLVAAVVKMILERWQPEPEPQWLTCVPSRTHPKLVPDFAQKVADELSRQLDIDLPFMPVIQKVNRNEQQKHQKNKFHQCNNLDGVFKVDDDIPQEPVLLIDDVTDSGWTLTIASALLLKAGSGPVFPLALTSADMNA
ncbi:MAG: RecQ family ATP-dependent DNA helicase [Gammaproteobacteria bacterium]|nr:RecQ family ATP-dependent DNA helicase [Gammaproteobacteria bacterium]